MARRHARDATSTRAALSGAHIAREKNLCERGRSANPEPRVFPGVDPHACIACIAAMFDFGVAKRMPEVFSFSRTTDRLFRAGAKPARSENAAFRAAMQESAASLGVYRLPSSSTLSGGRGVGWGGGLRFLPAAKYGFSLAYAKGRRFLRAITASERRSSALRDWPRLLT
jgi:hypothetical protein